MAEEASVPGTGGQMRLPSRVRVRNSNNNNPTPPPEGVQQIEGEGERQQRIMQHGQPFLSQNNMATTVATSKARVRNAKAPKKTGKRKARKGKGKKKTKKVVKRRKSVKKLPGFTNCYTQECGGVNSDPQCTYLGHSIALRQIMFAFSRSLVHKLYQTNGVDIIAFESVPLNNISTAIRIYFRIRDVNSAAATTQYFITATVGASYHEMAVDLATELFLRLTPTTELYDIWLTTDYTDDDATKSVLQFQNMKFNFHMTSMLKLQNTTEAATATDPLLGTNVSANPLSGKRYTKKSTGFVPTFRGTAAEASYKSFLADGLNGLITANNLHSALVQTKKPPPGSYFEARATNVMMGPGDIIIDRLSYGFNKSPQDLLRKLRGAFSHDGVLNNTGPIGEAHMYGMERLIDCRVAEPSIKLSYQLEQTYKASITYRKKKVIVPMLSVTAITSPETNP